MGTMYLVVRNDSGWDWDRYDYIAAYSDRDICEEACELLNKAVKQNDSYRREYIVKTVPCPVNLESFNEIIKDCLEDEE